MLSYEKFKELAMEKLSALVKQDYPDVEVRQNDAATERGVSDTLLFLRKHDGINITPTLYFTRLYGQYVQNGDFDYVMHQCYLELCDRMKFTSEIRKALDDQSALDQRITFELIHTEQNKEFLELVPHREFQDLSIIYQCIFRTENVEGRAYVTHPLAERLGVTEEELYDFAYENTKQVHKPIVRPFEDVILYLLAKGSEGLNVEEIPEMGWPPAIPLYMLSNGERKRGAVSILYTEELDKLASKLDSDLYILPASVDIVLLTSTNDFEPETLAQIVYEMNCQALLPEERLSNQIYHYNRQTQEISLATNTEHTMLSHDYEMEELESNGEVEQEAGMSMGMGL